MDRSVPILFYKTFFKSVLTFCIRCWGEALTIQNKNKLDRVVKLGRRITREPLNSTKRIWLTGLKQMHHVRCSLNFYFYLWSIGPACPVCGPREATHPLSHAAFRCLTSSDNRLELAECRTWLHSISMITLIMSPSVFLSYVMLPLFFLMCFMLLVPNQIPLGRKRFNLVNH